MIDASDPALRAYLASATALLVDVTSASVPALRRLLVELGMPEANVRAAAHYEEALLLCAETRPAIVFSELAFPGKGTGIDVFAEHCKAVPNRLQAVFILLSSESSPAGAAQAGDADVDALFVRPFNSGDLKNRFLDVLGSKLNPPPYLKLIEAGRRLLEAGKLEASLRAFAQAQSLDDKPAKACYFEGVVHQRAGDLQRARRCFERGLELQADHYRCLSALFELEFAQRRYDEAFEAGMRLAEHYPIQPRRIPELIRLCIHKERYSDVLRFAGAVSDLPYLDETLGRYVSAGLFICAKHLMKAGERGQAVKVFLKTEAVSRTRPSVLREIIAALYAAGEVEVAEQMLLRAPPEVARSAEVRMAILEQLHLKGIDQRVFHLSRELVHDGVLRPKLFEIALVQARALGKGDAVLGDLMARAVAAFPDRRAEFERLASGGAAAA